jgi:hypothetical protein
VQDHIDCCLGLLKGKKVAMVGYDDALPCAPDGYRVWDGNKVFVTRDVQFEEIPLISGQGRLYSRSFAKKER